MSDQLDNAIQILERLVGFEFTADVETAMHGQRINDQRVAIAGRTRLLL